MIQDKMIGNNVVPRWSQGHRPALAMKEGPESLQKPLAKCTEVD